MNLTDDHVFFCHIATPHHIIPHKQYFDAQIMQSFFAKLAFSRHLASSRGNISNKANWLCLWASAIGACSPNTLRLAGYLGALRLNTPAFWAPLWGLQPHTLRLTRIARYRS